MDVNLAKENILNIDKGSKLEDIKIDGIPIWWFFKPMLVLNSLPNPFLSFQEISNRAKKTKPRIIKTKIITFILKKYILRNERNKIRLRKRNPTYDEKGKILFLTYSNHIKGDNILRLSSIINKIKEDKKITPFTLITDNISKKADNLTSKYEHTIYEYVTKEILTEAKKNAKFISDEWKKSEKTEFHSYLSTELNFLLSKEILEVVIMYYLACEELIKKENIKTVIITADTGLMDRALIASLKDENIPIVSIHHGNPGTVPIETFSSTKICIKGKAFKKNLERTGFNGEIVITGFTDSDEILKYQEKLEKPKKTVLITTSPLVEDNFMKEEEYKSYIKKYIEDLNKIENIEIMISLHPREWNIKKYNSIVKKHHNVQVIKKVDIKSLYKLINYSDLLLFFGSGTAIEANILDKPTVYINLFGKEMPYIRLFENSGPILELNKEEDISIPIKNILENKEIKERLSKERKKFIEEYCYKVDGKATERIANEIYKSLEKWKKKS